MYQVESVKIKIFIRRNGLNGMSSIILSHILLVCTLGQVKRGGGAGLEEGAEVHPGVATPLRDFSEVSILAKFFVSPKF